MSVVTLAWVLPRPKPEKYPGGFPLWFEEKLLKHLDHPRPVLHVFGGLARHGYRLDMRRTHPLVRDDLIWTPPEVQGDAHALPFKDNSFGLVVCDPPYSAEESKRMYNTPPPVYSRYILEAVRVVQPGGLVASYHITLTPRPSGTIYHSRILIGTRVWHRLRACGIFQKL